MAVAGTKALEAWCKKITTGYANVNLFNMTTSWRSGLAFCAIIHHHCPELIDFHSLDPDDVFGNNSLAFSVAEQQLGIPSLLDPQDMVECELLDRLSILTYLAQYFQTFSKKDFRKENIIQTGSISNSSASTCLTDSVKLQMRNPMVGRQSDPCRQCGKSVFILERLNISGRILHRTCFKCVKCRDQLTLASFYETEAGQFCCEVCPDEDEGGKERQITLRVNQDLARLMVQDSVEKEGVAESTDTDGSTMIGIVGDNTRTEDEDKDDEVASTKSRSAIFARLDITNRNETGIIISVKDGSLVKKISGELHLNVNNNNETDTKVVEGSHFDANLCGEVDPMCPEELAEEMEVIEDEDDEDPKDYPEEKNPFGDDQDEDTPSKVQCLAVSKHVNLRTPRPISNTSSNPFGSDLDSDENDGDVQASLETSNYLSSSNVSIPPPSLSLNPFGSDLSSDEEVSGPKVSPTLSTRSTVISKKKLSGPVRRVPHRPAPIPPTITKTTTVPSPRSSSPGSTFQRKSQDICGPSADTAKTKRLKDSTSAHTSTMPENYSIPTMSVTTSARLAKADEDQLRKKKSPAPPRPSRPPRVKKLARKVIDQELFDIEVRHGGLERQGVQLEKTIRDLSAASEAEVGDEKDSVGPEAEDLIIQLFDLVNEKNELYSRQTELIYMKKLNKFEEMHADCEYQIRVLMSKPECQRTDDDKMSEEKLLAKLVEIVTLRNEIVDCLEMDRLRELDEDRAVEDNMSSCAAAKPVEEGKPKKKSARKKLIRLASKKLSFSNKK